MHADESHQTQVEIIQYLMFFKNIICLVHALLRFTAQKACIFHRQGYVSLNGICHNFRDKCRWRQIKKNIQIVFWILQHVRK